MRFMTFSSLLYLVWYLEFTISFYPGRTFLFFLFHRGCATSIAAACSPLFLFLLMHGANFSGFTKSSTSRLQMKAESDAREDLRES